MVPEAISKKLEPMSNGENLVSTSDAYLRSVQWLSPLILATLLATTLVKALVTTDDFYSLEKLVFISPLQVVVPSLVRGFPSQEVGTRYAY